MSWITSKQLCHQLSLSFKQAYVVFPLGKWGKMIQQLLSVLLIYNLKKDITTAIGAILIITW